VGNTGKIAQPLLPLAAETLAHASYYLPFLAANAYALRRGAGATAALLYVSIALLCAIPATTGLAVVGWLSFVPRLLLPVDATALLLALAFFLLPVAEAGRKDKAEVMSRHKRIMFIPHDNRPISDKQTADVVRELGYEVIVPPDDMLGSRTDLGHPEELWAWAEENASSVGAAVISSDSMLYGSLVGSRKHDYTRGEVMARLKNFEEFRAAHPALPLYVFGSIMRTPRSGEASGHEEPEYYRRYGADIFRYLYDKGCEGVFVEAFGLGGVPFLHNNILEEIDRASSKGMSILVGSQCRYEGSNLDVYETGLRVQESGGIPVFDMTQEATVTKLMWALGRSKEREDVRKSF